MIEPFWRSAEQFKIDSLEEAECWFNASPTLPQGLKPGFLFCSLRPG
jgi:hypothetical protein